MKLVGTVVISRTLRYWMLLACFAAMSCSLQAQGKERRDIQESCRGFAQDFYDWYVPKALSPTRDGPTSDVAALKEKPDAFGPELSRLLREDWEAQEKVTGFTVGLDFDPFLFGQDPAEHYVIRNIVSKGDRCWVDVYSIPPLSSQKPNVVAELVLRDGRWRFVNFHYPDSGPNENLLSVLKFLRTNRQKHPTPK
jgi:hypothetical protein